MRRVESLDMEPEAGHLQGPPGRPYSYTEVGALRTLSFPDGYIADRHRVQLGHGQACYDRALAALWRWEMFNVGWVKLQPRVPAIRAGELVRIDARILGVRFTNECGIAYLHKEPGPVQREGFALGTLARHVLHGEERFCIEWDHGNNTVWYSVAAFSRPAKLVAKIGYPAVRRMQARFARHSHAAMLKAVAAG